MMAAMPKRIHLKQKELARAVAAALETCQHVKDHQRLLAMRMAASGEFTADQIAGQLNVSRRQFFNWLKAARSGGVEALLERNHGGGARPALAGRTLEEFKEGLRTGRWKRAREIQRWLQAERGVKVGLTGVYYWLGKLGGVLKVPRKAHAKKDAAAAAEFQRTLGDKLGSLNVAGGRPVRIWVADEHRYGLIPVVRKCWTLRGLRPSAPYQTKYEWGFLHSLLEVDGENDAEFLCSPEVNLETSALFLRQLAARFPDAEHVVIWDQAGFHPKHGSPLIPQHIHLLPLPPYSPELNPVEAIGDLIKDRLGNVLWKTLDEMEEAIGEEIRPLHQMAERVRTLVSHPWLIEQLNATAP
jgi:transposase